MFGNKTRQQHRPFKFKVSKKVRVSSPAPTIVSFGVRHF